MGTNGYPKVLGGQMMEPKCRGVSDPNEIWSQGIKNPNPTGVQSAEGGGGLSFCLWKIAWKSLFRRFRLFLTKFFLVEIFFWDGHFFVHLDLGVFLIVWDL